MGEALARRALSLLDRRTTRALIVGADVVVLVALLGAMQAGVELLAGQDAEIYVEAGRRLAAGQSLYDFGHPLTGFGFTYPPFAAMVFTTLVPFGSLAPHVVQAASLAGLVVVVAACLHACGARAQRLVWGTAAVVPAAVLLYPNTRSIGSGQVDLVLGALVVADLLLLRDRRLHGLLSGLAAAVKITPSLFILVHLARARWRAAATMVLTAVLVHLVALAVTPSGSVDFWTVRLWDTSRVGAQTAALNQSWGALVARLSPSPEGTVHGFGVGIWAILVVATVAWTVRALVRGGVDDPLRDVAVVALCALLVSPISWLHHWAMATVPLMALAHLAVRGSRTAGVLLALGVAVLAVPPWWYLGGYVGAGWGPVSSVVGSATVLWGAAALMHLGRVRSTPSPEPSD